MADDSPWTARLADDIGKRVGEAQARLGMSAQQLSDALTDVGVPMARPVLSNLKNGRRHTISVPELIALAYVLRVSPLLLIFPVGASDDSEVLPGVTSTPWDAAKWFMGEDVFPTDRNADDVTAQALKRELAAPIQRFREHDKLIEQYRRTARNVARATEQGDTDAAEAGRSILQGLERVVPLYRDEIRRAGDTPPDLPDALQHLDAVPDLEAPTYSVADLREMEQEYYSRYGKLPKGMT